MKKYDDKRRFFLNQELAKKDFGTLKECIKKYGLNWRHSYNGVDDIKCFKDLPKKYIQERDVKIPRIFVGENVMFVDTIEEATHHLVLTKRGLLCKIL